MEIAENFCISLYILEDSWGLWWRAEQKLSMFIVPINNKKDGGEKDFEWQSLQYCKNSSEKIIVNCEQQSVLSFAVLSDSCCFSGPSGIYLYGVQWNHCSAVCARYLFMCTNYPFTTSLSGSRKALLEIPALSPVTRNIFGLISPYVLRGESIRLRICGTVGKTANMLEGCSASFVIPEYLLMLNVIAERHGYCVNI